MNLTELISGYRRSEPTFIFVLKLVIMVMLIVCLTGYFAIMIIDVNQDAPIIMTSFVTDAIRPPNFIFTSKYNFILNCLKAYYKVNDTATMVDCASDITQLDGKYGPDQFYFGFYQPSQDILFHKFKKSNDYTSLISIDLGFGIIDNNYIPGADLPGILAFDSEYDPTSEYIKEKRYYELTMPEYLESTSQISQFNYSISGMNTYSLPLNQMYQFSYSRMIKEVIKPSWMNDFGIPPTYIQIPYITSNLLATSNPYNGTNPKMFVISIKPTSGSIQVDREVRTHTYLGGLGLMGGAWGLATAIYAMLFGVDTLRPWGIVQSYCCGFSRLTKNKLKNTFPIIPFFSKSYLDNKNHLSKFDLSLDEKIELVSILQSRIDSLELFLQEYVVDVNYLNGIWDKSKMSGNSTENTENMTSSNLNNQAILSLREGCDNPNMNSTVSTADMQQ
ncbi:hypothetical protein C1645_839419 [Glomus cerebriforme]|uniref:Uncharacterized protein n=1 Tax=Glomus cerebriforme TaxID=658196 RepID=A0A397S6R0_9GLOM|nr:hypothetical protein C1645_839419 [Glomus cerebriforme]